jgi:Ser/Thr protein kinase RdoA (MazF antagonist)
VARATEPIIEDMVSRREALCHGDYTPKNMLVHADGFMLVDYETAHLGDATMDLGLLFAHLTLKCVRRREDAPRLLEAMDTIWRAYAEPAPPLADAEARGAAHLGAILLARIDGASPVEYLPEESKREIVRSLGRLILLNGLRRWDAIWSWLRDR